MNAYPAGPYPPNNELVAVAWLGQRVPGLTPLQVATTLPKPGAGGTLSWAETGFVQVQAIPGGSPDIYTHVRHPVLQVDCWAATPSSSKPFWALANRLAELIRIATEDGQVYGKPVELPADYMPARVQAAYLVNEPTRVSDDPSGYARYTLDLALDWVRQ